MDRATIVNILIALGLFLLVSVYGFFSALHPPRMLTPVTPAVFNVNYEDVSLPAGKGVVLHGWFIPAANPKAPAIILTHGYGGDKGNILQSRLFLHRNYNLLFFDFRYFGKSGGDYSTIGHEETADLDAAIHFLNKKGINKIAIWGLSMGAAVALMSAENHPSVKAVIAEASYAKLSMLASEYFKIPLLRYPLGWLLRYWAYLYFGYDIDAITPEKASALLRMPVLYMHSKSDEVVPFKHFNVLQDAAKENPQAKFYIYNNEMHGQLPADYQQKILIFLKKAFK